MTMELTLSTFDAPLGELLLVTDQSGTLRALDYADHRSRMNRLLRVHYGQHTLVPGPTPAPLKNALTRYFSGDLDALSAITVQTHGSELEEKVWHALRAIPVGQTKSYGQLARDVGLTDPLAAKDIGGVNNANPVAIVTPCHRVVAKNGELKGYAGGAHRKAWLLGHERALTPDGTRPVTGGLPGV
jgi:methylated-DNA-[protein]-cysteine S-methyltransferase